MDFDREYRRDVNEGLTAGRWTFWKFFFVFLPIVIVLAGLGYAVRLASQPARIIEKTFDADNVIHNYEWFKQRYQSILAIDQKITDAKKTVEQFKKEAGVRENWHREDREEHSRLSAIAQGLEQQRADLAAEYNARSKMANRSIFKAGDNELPETIPLN